MEFRLAEWPDFEVPRMDGLPVTPSTKHPTSADTRSRSSHDSITDFCGHELDCL